MFNTDEIYPVSSFLQLCNKVINQNIPNLWISGEISNLSLPGSGHIYFSIKDEKSQIKCAFFRLSQRNLSFKLENGLQVMVRAGASIYEIRGDFQLIVSRVEPIGVGSLELGFEQLKAKLLKEGIFDNKHKKPLPKSPQTIGVITSQTGAVIQDIKQVLSKRYPFANIIIYDTPTQGEFASSKIITALQIADTDNKCDVLIIARGGGSREDLWAFNDEYLVRAIFNANTPIVTSIGHETDTTMVDFVSDVRAPTPSAAAMLVSPDKLEIMQRVADNYKRLHRVMLNNLAIWNKQISQLHLRIGKPNFNKNYQKIDDLLARLQYSINNNLVLKKSNLNIIYGRLNQNNPRTQLDKSKQLNTFYLTQIVNHLTKHLTNNNHKLTIINNNLHKSIANILIHNKQNLSKNITILNNLSPLKTLSRGYSISSVDNKVLLSKKTVKDGDIIHTKLSDGEIFSKVIGSDK